MASALTKRYLTRVSGGANKAFALAKKRADLAIKTNVDEKGQPTDAAYKLAAAFLSPFVSSEDDKTAVDAQRILAGYDNTLAARAAKRNLQVKTVSDFKLREHDSYFIKDDGDVLTFRDPETLARVAQQNLDSLLIDVATTIEGNKANGIDTDALEGYFNGLSDRAAKMRTLVSRIDGGQLAKDQFLGEFGVFVKTEPTTGEVYGAAVLPVGQTIDGLEKDYQRAPVTTSLRSSGATLPVYGIAGQDVKGNKTINVGKDSWTWNPAAGKYRFSGTDDVSKAFKAQGAYSLMDPSRFPAANTAPQPGSLRKGLVGFGENGVPQYETLYYGLDGKKYSVNDEQVKTLTTVDPLLAERIRYGGTVTVDPNEFRAERADAIPHDGFIGADMRTAHSERLDQLLKETGVPNGYSGTAVAPQESPAAQPEAKPMSSFFGAKNRPDVPDAAPTGRTASDIVDAGKSFFRKLIG